MADLLDKLTSAFELYNPIFHDLSRPVADVFGLENLGPHFDVLVYSFVLFNFANIVLVPGLSSLFFNQIYGCLDMRARNKWYVALPRSPSRVELSVPGTIGGHMSSFSVDVVVHPWISFRETDLCSRHPGIAVPCH